MAVSYSKGIKISIHALLAESDASSGVDFAEDWLFLSTLSLRRATTYFDTSSIDDFISIHALLAESDMMPPFIACALCVFLSTLSLRRATHGQKSKGLHSVFLSTLSLRRATAPDISIRREASISIHALLAESDNTVNFAHDTQAIFLSTLSLRRATIRKRQVVPIIQISIHALLAESDKIPD